MRQILLLVLLLSTVLKTKAQDVPEPDQLSQITYDYYNDKITGKMPFDQFFKVIFKGIPSSSIEKVLFYEVIYKNGVRDVKIKDIQNGTPLSSIAQVLNISDTKGLKNSSESIVSPIRPERFYEIAIVKKNTETHHLIFNEFLSMVTKPDPVTEQIKFFNEKILPINNKLEQRTIPLNSFPTDFPNFIARINPILSFYSNPAQTPSLNLIIKDASINRTLISKVANLLKTNKLSDTAYIKVMPMFLNNELKKIMTFCLGINEEVKDFNFDQRLTNLKKSIEILEDLKIEIEALQLIENDSDVDGFYKSFVVKERKTLISNYQALAKFNAKLKKLINHNLPEIVLISASTLGNDLKTSNANSLVPDVGLVNAIGYNDKGNFKYIGRPYLGLNYHFSGIDRTQYLREIPKKSFRHRFSLAVGITLGKINTEDYEDFYSGISPTLGFNYRLTRQIRAGVGTLFVREKNQNPIVTSTKVALAPYLSISFDLGLFSEASKLTKLIGF